MPTPTQTKPTEFKTADRAHTSFLAAAEKANADLDRDAAAGWSELRPPDRAGLRLADLGRRRLLVRALQSLGAAAGDPASGAELVRRFARRYAGPRAQPAASALRVLRGSHSGCAGHELPDGRSGSFRLHVAAGGGRISESPTCCFRSKSTWRRTPSARSIFRIGALVPPSCGSCCSIGNLFALWRPYAIIAGREFLLFDVGFAVGAAALAAILAQATVKHIAMLYREETLR